MHCLWHLTFNTCKANQAHMMYAVCANIKGSYVTYRLTLKDHLISLQVCTDAGYFQLPNFCQLNTRLLTGTQFNCCWFSLTKQQ